jgi:hypothetical protein
MFFDLEAAQGDWFAFFESRVDPASGEIVYDEPKPDAAEFCIRSLQPFWEERLGGRKREYKFVNNPKSHGMERVGYYPDLSYEETKKERDDALDYAITGIRNAKWAEGTDIECTRDNKLKLRKIPAFDRFLGRVWQILDSAGVKDKEAESEKN